MTGGRLKRDRFLFQSTVNRVPGYAATSKCVQTVGRYDAALSDLLECAGQSLLALCILRHKSTSVAPLHFDDGRNNTLALLYLKTTILCPRTKRPTYHNSYTGGGVVDLRSEYCEEEEVFLAKHINI